MEYSCPVCRQKINEGSEAYINHTEEHIVDLIKDKHPEWEGKDGVCHKCYDYYRKQLKGK